jgi:signal transduction histidine kinase
LVPHGVVPEQSHRRTNRYLSATVAGIDLHETDANGKTSVCLCHFSLRSNGAPKQPEFGKGAVMSVQSYQLQSDSLAIRTANDGKRHAVTIPSGTRLGLLDAPLGARRLIEVVWNSEKVLMFTDDFQEDGQSPPESRTNGNGTTRATQPDGIEQALIEHSLELARSNEELERFAFAVAHDLRAPLRSIETVTQLFLKRNAGTLHEESAQLLDFVVSSAERMDRLIQDLLEFAKVSQQVETSEVDAKAVAELAAQNLQEAVDQSRATIFIESLPMIHANEGQLLRLFQNLISNAIKYRGEDTPEIHIAASSIPGKTAFSVSDNGIGIDPQYHQQIFDPFRRLHTDSEYEGTGVGLAICKRIVQQHNGRIWVKSKPGEGSTFYFTIPDSEPTKSTLTGIPESLGAGI